MLRQHLDFYQRYPVIFLVHLNSFMVVFLHGVEKREGGREKEWISWTVLVHAYFPGEIINSKSFSLKNILAWKVRYVLTLSGIYCHVIIFHIKPLKIGDRAMLWRINNNSNSTLNLSDWLYGNKLTVWVFKWARLWSSHSFWLGCLLHSSPDPSLWTDLVCLWFYCLQNLLMVGG